jgi:ribonucrease Y
LGCLFHDIGKVITDEEGSHVELGVKLLKKYEMPQPVIDAVAQHHEDTAFTSKESVLVYIADAISGARPGARYENYEEYVKRLDTMETIAKEKTGALPKLMPFKPAANSGLLSNRLP